MIALTGAMEVGYDDVGVGTPAVFLHPFPADRTYWAPQLGALVDHSRCIAPDLRGFGESTVGPPYTVDQYADDVAVLLDVLGVERAVVCGLSLGGYVALAFWRRHRHRVRALVLADTRAGADTDEARERRRALAALARERGAAAVADAQITGLVGKSTRERHPELVDALHHMLEIAPVEGIVGALEAMMARPDSTPLLAGIDVPTLVVVGAEDVLTPEAEARRLHAGIPGSRLEVIAGAGHVSSFERPAAFNHIVSEFLASLVFE
ncbi:MAG: alpha/beta fold hydrolase [Gemmatimonadaceae bacterium]